MWVDVVCGCVVIDEKSREKYRSSACLICVRGIIEKGKGRNDAILREAGSRGLRPYVYYESLIPAKIPKWKKASKLGQNIDQRA